MGNKFTVVKSINAECEEEVKRIRKIIAINEAWERQYNKTLLVLENRKCEIADLPQSDLMRIGFSGIKYICSMNEIQKVNDKLGISDKSLEMSNVKFQFIDGIFTILGYLTLRNFVTTFPITKEYDGEKWQSKDYFFTMDVLSNMDWDKPIGRDKISDLLWDYQNNDLRSAYVEYMCVTSALYRSQTGKGIAEQWVEDMGLPTYEVEDDSGFIRDNQTGKVSKMEKSSHIQIVK